MLASVSFPCRLLHACLHAAWWQSLRDPDLAGKGTGQLKEGEGKRTNPHLAPTSAPP